MKSKLVTSKKILCCSLWHSNVELGGQIVLAIMHIQLQLVLPRKREQDTDRSFGLIQNGQLLQHDRIIDCKLTYEGISGKYETKFQLNENEFFPNRP
jgi:hypothetical protein